MSELAISVEDVHKRYRLGTIGSGLIADEVKAIYARITGRTDPRLSIDQEKDMQRQGMDFWSLRGVSFDVKKGEILGVIGHNGAGKSTLLKLLSRITLPTKGTIKMTGKVSSLLEVGTGFHPELTGIENIYLNGSIMGMRRAEITARLDEIIEFSGIEHHIDTPIKRYSSGMKVRLGFAVAAHLEPDILILDEVLAVGDAEFQKKCLGKMQEVSTKEGRTVIFVSHNLAAVKTLCNRAILLDKGAVTFQGDTTDTINYYLKGDTEARNYRHFGKEFDTDEFKLDEISFNPVGGSIDDALDEYQTIEIHLKIHMKRNGARRRVNFTVQDDHGVVLFVFSSARSDVKLHDGLNHLVCTFPQGFLNIGNYFLSMHLFEDDKSLLYNFPNMAAMQIQEGERAIGKWMGREPGFIKPRFEWSNSAE